MEELGRYKEAMDRVMTAIRCWGLDYAYVVEPLAREINSILNPPPEFETVEVIQFCTIGARGNAVSVYDTAEELKDARPATPDSEIVKLTGTYQRPKPQKVDRSVDGTSSNGKAHFDTGSDGWPPHGTRCKITWTE